MTKLPKPLVTVPLAHRAFHDVTDGRPENSVSAVKAAVSRGYGIEIDVQLSSDGQAIVFHDYDLKRLTGTSGPLRQRPARELAEIGLIGSGEGIPDLSVVLQCVSGQVPILVEIKDQDGAMGTDIGPLELAVAKALGGYIGPVAVMSFNPHSVAEMKRLAPNICRGLTTGRFHEDNWSLVPKSVRDDLRRIPDYDRTGSCFISHNSLDLGRARVMELKNAGAKILTWTVRSAEAELEARTIADNITFEGYEATLPS